ncbi:MAG: hypothetical protein K940chlam7_00340, partial [Chlamydiae bacterium]|nr:hypothetical protein [Chlamydiota bacterium]
TFIPSFSLGVVPTPNFRIYNHSLNEMSISRVPVRGPSEIARPSARYETRWAGFWIDSITRPGGAAETMAAEKEDETYVPLALRIKVDILHIYSEICYNY